MGSVIVSILGINALNFSAVMIASIGILYLFISESKDEERNINEKMIGSE